MGTLEPSHPKQPTNQTFLNMANRKQRRSGAPTTSKTIEILSKNFATPLPNLSRNTYLKITEFGCDLGLISFFCLPEAQSPVLPPHHHHRNPGFRHTGHKQRSQVHAPSRCHPRSVQHKANGSLVARVGPCTRCIQSWQEVHSAITARCALSHARRASDSDGPALRQIVDGTWWEPRLGFQ